MELEKTYYEKNGKYQQKANELFGLLTTHGEFYGDNKGENLGKLGKFIRFYYDVYFYYNMQKVALKNFNSAVNYGNTYPKDKNKYECKNFLELEKMLDNLVLKAYEEQKKIGSI